MANKNEMSVQSAELNELHQIGDFGVNELMTMKETIGKDLSISQFNLFMYQSNRMGLDPSLRHVFPIMYGGKMDFRISYEGLKALAQKSDGYLGVYSQVVCENEVDDFEAILNDEGEITGFKHKPKFPRGKVVGAFAIAKREGRANQVVFMDVSEVQKWMKKNGNFWKQDNGDVDPDMFKKHVSTRAIKAQYDIADVVVEGLESNTVGGSDDIPEYKPERKDITPQTEIIEAPKEPEKPKQDDQAKKIRTSITKVLKELGVSGKKATAEYMAEKNINLPSNPSLEQLNGVLRTLEGLLEMKKMDDELSMDGVDEDFGFDLDEDNQD